MRTLEQEFQHAWEVENAHANKRGAWIVNVWTRGENDEMVVGEIDQQLVQLEHDLWGCRRICENWREFWDNGSGWYVKVSRVSRQIDVRGNNLDVTKRLSTKVLVNLYRAAIINTGGIAVHASGVAYEGQGWAFCGPPLAGKTTCVMDLLATGKVSYLGNDILYITRDRMVMPPIWGPAVGRQTLMSIPRFAWLGSGTKTGKATIGRYVQSTTGEKKLYIPVPELVGKLGVPIAPMVRLRAIFFPSLDLKGDGVRVQPLQWGDAWQILRANANLAGDGDHPDWMSLVECKRDERALNKRIADLFPGLVFARVVLGCRSRGKHDLLQALREILARAGAMGTP